MSQNAANENFQEGRVTPETMDTAPSLSAPKGSGTPPITPSTPAPIGQNTPRTGAKVIQRCLTDLDDLILRRKKELTDIQRSGSFKIVSTHKNKLNIEMDSEHGKPTAVQPSKTEIPSRASNIPKPISKSIFNKENKQSLSYANLKSNLHSQSLAKSSRANNFHESSITSTNEKAAAALASSQAKDSRLFVRPKPGQHGATFAHDQENNDMNNEISFFDMSDNLAQSVQTTSSPISESEGELETIVTKTVITTSKEVHKHSSQNSHSSSYHSSGSNSNSKYYSHSNDTQGDVQHDSELASPYSEQIRSRQLTPSRFQIEAGDLEKENLKLQLKAANAKIALLDDKIRDMELHVEGNLNGYNQKIKLLNEEKTKLNATCTQLNDEVLSLTDELQFVRSQSQSKAATISELETETVRLKRELQDLQDAHEDDRLVGRSLFGSVTAGGDNDELMRTVNEGESPLALSQPSSPIASKSKSSPSTPSTDNLYADLVQQYEQLKQEHELLKSELDSTLNENKFLLSQRELQDLQESTEREISADILKQYEQLKQEYEVLKGEHYDALNENKLLISQREIQELQERAERETTADVLLQFETLKQKWEQLSSEHENTLNEVNYLKSQKEVQDLQESAKREHIEAALDNDDVPYTDDMLQQFENLKQECEVLRNERDTSLNESITHSADLLQQYEQLKQDYAVLRSELDSALNENKRLILSQTEVQDSQERTERDPVDAVGDGDGAAYSADILQQFENLKQECEVLRSERDNTLNELHERDHLVGDDSEAERSADLLQQYEQLKQDYGLLKSEHDHALIENTSLQSQLRELKERSNHERFNLTGDSDTAELFQQFEVLKQELEVSRGEYDDALHENGVLAKYLEEALQERNGLWVQLETLQSTVSNSEMRIAEMESKLSQVTEELQKEKHEAETMYYQLNETHDLAIEELQTQHENEIYSLKLQFESDKADVQNKYMEKTIDDEKRHQEEIIALTHKMEEYLTGKLQKQKDELLLLNGNKHENGSTTVDSQTSSKHSSTLTTNITNKLNISCSAPPSSHPTYTAGVDLSTHHEPRHAHIPGEHKHEPAHQHLHLPAAHSVNHDTSNLNTPRRRSGSNDSSNAVLDGMHLGLTHRASYCNIQKVETASKSTNELDHCTVYETRVSDPKNLTKVVAPNIESKENQLITVYTADNCYKMVLRPLDATNKPQKIRQTKAITAEGENEKVVQQTAVTTISNKSKSGKCGAFRLFLLATFQGTIWLLLLLAAYLYVEHIRLYGTDPIKLIPYRFTS